MGDEDQLITLQGPDRRAIESRLNNKLEHQLQYERRKKMTSSSPCKGLTPASVIISRLEKHDKKYKAESMLPPPMQFGTTRSSESRIHTRRSHQLTCTVCREIIYPTESPVQSHGRLLHASCFSCQLCDAKLKHHPMELLLPARDSYQRDDDSHDDEDDDNPDDENHNPQHRKQQQQHQKQQQQQPFSSTPSYCICSKCRIGSMYAHTTKIQAPSAGERRSIP